MTLTLDGTVGMTAPSTAVYNGIQTATAQTSTSGTAILFTSIPLWVKRITLLFNGMSTNGTSIPLVQIGSGAVTTSGYNGYGQNITTVPASASTAASTGWPIQGSSAGNAYYGALCILNITGNTWVVSGTLNNSASASGFINGSLALSGQLDRVNVTTTSGTDTFDAGTINIFYE
jgi:hypothetical protein